MPSGESTNVLANAVGRIDFRTKRPKWILMCGKVVEIDSRVTILISKRNRNLGRVKDACGDEGGTGDALTFKVKQLHRKKLRRLTF